MKVMLLVLYASMNSALATAIDKAQWPLVKKVKLFIYIPKNNIEVFWNEIFLFFTILLELITTVSFIKKVSVQHFDQFDFPLKVIRQVKFSQS
jgi:hypothetical protein